MEKHAFLIMAHGEERLLRLLLNQLDDARNDVFLHIDRNATALRETCRDWQLDKARLFVIPEPVAVYWGHVSQVEAELLLLRTASRQGPYAYYHLLSGADLAIKTQDQFHQFFADHQGKEFVGFWNEESHRADALRKVRYHYFFVRYRRKGVNRLQHALCMPLMNIALALQKALRLDRCKKTGRPKKGYNWFSITEACCRYVVERESQILHRYRRTLCPDEIFLQTLLADSPFAPSLYDTENTERGSLRAIDWHRGHPYVWQKPDVPALLQSPCIFARKFSETHLDAALSIVSQTSS